MKLVYVIDRQHWTGYAFRLPVLLARLLCHGRPHLVYRERHPVLNP